MKFLCWLQTQKESNAMNGAEARKRVKAPMAAVIRDGGIRGRGQRETSRIRSAGCKRAVDPAVGAVEVT